MIRPNREAQEKQDSPTELAGLEREGAPENATDAGEAAVGEQK